ncbi:MAG: band 7 protein [Alphaproteobacteria bacterium]|nr:band 7 protein [Alphaproteobacteria bacterium]MCB9697654.1 band 7 protein [Alphaproteobacteria bacterium]
MAQISRFFFLRHLRSEASRHVVLARHGQKVMSARGASFWFLPMTASIAEVPVDDRELTVIFKGVTRDFQTLTAQGVVGWRVSDPERLAERLDFSIDLTTGAWLTQPLEQVGALINELAQQVANAWVGEVELAVALVDGVVELRQRIGEALSTDEGIAGLGIDLTSVRITSVRPDAEVERALQTPARERIQRDADKATFERRAHAVEQERAIAENELNNKIQLAKREEQLIAQKGANEQRRLKEEALALRIQVEASAERERLQSATQAATLLEVEGAKVETERGRIAIYESLPPHVMLGLAARELAANLPEVQHLTITPDLLAPALAQLAGRS